MDTRMFRWKMSLSRKRSLFNDFWYLMKITWQRHQRLYADKCNFFAAALFSTRYNTQGIYYNT